MEGAAATLSAAEMLGMDDPMQDDIKEVSVSVVQPSVRRQKQKMCHRDFFDDDRGLKKVLKTFPSIKFQGKGHEFEDLKILIRNYERWFKDICPGVDHIEDAAMKARGVLQVKEEQDDGQESDPHERLHMLRFRYKSGSLLESPAAPPKTELSEDAATTIAENRERALKLREERRAKAAAEAAKAGGDAALDMEAELQRAAATAVDEEEEDPFGFGGGMDDDGGAPPTAPAAALAAAAPAVDAEVARRIAENKAKALALKQQKQREKEEKERQQQAEQQKAAPQQPDDEAFGPAFEEEEDPFGFGGGFDEA